MLDLFRTAEATRWARDAGGFVSFFDPGRAPDAWATYLDGLSRIYSRHGIARIVNRGQLERRPASAFMLIHTREGEVLGGLRVEGPFTRASDYAGFDEMSKSPDLQVLREHLDKAAAGGLVELKGAWAEKSGFGKLLARCLDHARWWLGSAHAFCTCATHVWPVWASSGGTKLDGVAAVPYPDERYHSIVMLWDGTVRRATPSQTLHLALERRYLEPFRPEQRDGSTVADWHPEILFADSKRLDELRGAGAAVSDPSDRFRAELDEISPGHEPAAADEPVHWVYYPWRSTIVKLLGPSDHRRLRTDRNRHKLTYEQLCELERREIGVVGLSAGSSTAFLLAQEGLCGRLRLADFDRLELTNLNRLQASVLDLGERKTHVSARRIAELDPYLPVELFDDGVTAENLSSFVSGLDAVVEECDSLDIKLLVRERAAEHGVPVIMETSDRGMLDVERFDEEPDRPPFHGLLAGLDVAGLGGLATEDKVPYVLAILESKQLSASMAASMIEIDATTTTWPQLASDIALGSSLVAASIRRLFVSSSKLTSGRTRLDLDAVLDSLQDPEPPRKVVAPPATIVHPALPSGFPAVVEAAARLAPSGGNMQPWRLDADDERFEVEIAPRTVVGMDVGLRGSAVACGAALANALAVAAFHRRLAAEEKRLRIGIDLDRPELAGTIFFGETEDQEWAELAPYVATRISNRRPGPAEPLDERVLRQLEFAASIPVVPCVSTALRYVPVDDLAPLVDVWAESDRIRYLTRRLHQELMSELRQPGVDDISDGLDERTLELPETDLAKLDVLRRWDVMEKLAEIEGGSRLGDDTRDRLAASSGLLALTIDGSTQDDYVAGGIALQRLWLTATKLGHWLHPMTPVFIYAQTATDLENLTDERLGADLMEMRRTVYDVFGCDDSEAFVMTARIHTGPAPTAVSRRRSSAASEVVSSGKSRSSIRS